MSFDQKTYNRDYYKKNSERLKKDARDYYKKKIKTDEGKEKAKLARELLHFGVPRSVIMRKTNGRCYLCGKKATAIHHLDEDGRTNEKIKKEPGKDPSRLVPICKACHIDIHRAKTLIHRKTRANGFWSRTYDRCISCGRNDRKHNGHGLCFTCAAAKKRQARARN